MSFVQIGIPQKDDVDGNKVKKKKALYLMFKYFVLSSNLSSS